MLTQKYRYAGYVIVFLSLFLVSSTYAALWHYEYDATLIPISLNGGGFPPLSATATGTFWYDDTNTPTLGFYPLGGLTFEPEFATTASPLDCDSIGGCIAQNASNFAEYNPTSDLLGFSLNVPSESYYVAFPGLYSVNNASGDIIGIEIRAVPVPAAIYLLGAGFIGLAGLRKKTTK
jgi:hypothetical protein